MSSKPCKCGDPVAHARILESYIMECLGLAGTQPEREKHWRDSADEMEQKFTTQHFRHYSWFLYPDQTPN